MNNQKLPTNKSTQEILYISDIVDDMIILKDGTVRAVLMVSSINFALKNQDEQESIIDGYYSFLNSLAYPLQIVIQSRNIDIDSYIEKIDKLSKQQTNELLRMQTLDYLQFIQELLELQAIMTKKFYVIVPYSAISNKKRTFLNRVSDFFSTSADIVMKKKQLDEYRDQLYRRVAQIQDGLAEISLQAVPLDTASLIELYYNSYNPEISKSQKLKNIDKLQLEK
ncbi:MAG: TraC family protein [Patescibacteria group bacterium]|nr:TraC family protein [Patescibacteria group bacterium]